MLPNHTSISDTYSLVFSQVLKHLAFYFQPVHVPFWPVFFFNSLPNDKSLDMTKLKAFADNKINLAQMMISVFDRVGNIVGKGENAGYQHFLFFQQCFQKASFLGVVKSQDCVLNHFTFIFRWFF